MAATMNPEQSTARRRRAGDTERRGVTVDMAPCWTSTVDRDGAIGDRSFSADPNTAARYAGASPPGCATRDTAGVKHFPGMAGQRRLARRLGPPRHWASCAPTTWSLPGAVGTERRVMVGHLNVPG